MSDKAYRVLFRGALCVIAFFGTLILGGVGWWMTRVQANCDQIPEIRSDVSWLKEQMKSVCSTMGLADGSVSGTGRSGTLAATGDRDVHSGLLAGSSAGSSAE